ncbi:MAG: CheA signal transduction histidine kinase [Polyangiaceae bacterium]|jgi:chemotaxis protein histidine kinase CheA/CheY-like chemotaxis protein|nr:CheA signal transduction histidine kinase [Polyangiaceae bacterium]
MTQPREALLARFRAGLIERVRATQRLVDEFQSTSDPERLQLALGELHTLKGESRMLGLSEISELSHALETELGAAQRFSLALGAFDAMLNALIGGEGNEALRAALVSLQGERPATSLPPAAPDASEVAPAPERRKKVGDRFMQVDAGLIDLLCERVAELTAAFGQLETNADALIDRSVRHARTAKLTDAFERCRALLDEATSTAWTLRLVSIDPLLEELARHARNAAERQHKLVEVQTIAGGVQLERDVADQLWESLLHLVQNAVDHGIEEPEARGAKPPVARLRLSAESVGPNVVLRVEDDGRGIDPTKIREAAVARGVLSAEVASELSDTQATELLFEHGFSTRSVTSRTSGRGVGLDVVRRRVESLGGHVGIESQPGLGTRFSLGVPFAITKEKLLVVELSGAPYGFPARVVRAVLGPSARPLPGQDSVVRHNGELLPFRSLCDALSLPQTGDENVVLVLELSGRKFGASVGRIIGERELIRRPAEKLLHQTGIGASAVLEDGRIVLLPELNYVNRALRARAGQVVPGAVDPERRRQRVLVADDSPVVRELVTEILSAAGLIVQQAVDGASALESILQSEPDLVVSDVEMPRMNGFDLLAEVRKRTQRLPVIMLSTRGSVEDRKRATRLGANAYLVKTEFHSESLLEVVRRFVNLRG